MKKCIVTLILFSIIIISQSCTTMLIGQALNKDQQLSAEQIKAYNEVGLDVYMCFTLGGPPPMGNMTIITVPKNKAIAPISYSSNCSILQATLTNINPPVAPAISTIQVVPAK